MSTAGGFMPNSAVPAAQYLRMSTDHQQYSLDNQADAIALYAANQGFQIVKTYSDAARSGLRLQNRPGLKQLLKDVVAGTSEFRAILVYDVSRWGRFQDVDEAAHYEYLCKSSGTPILYCAETFSNDNSTSGLILKALKRTMAGEYSRDLSARVKAGLLRLAKLGYKQGGVPPYGMQRLLLDVHGNPKQPLAAGERKSLTTERVILVPGPANEVRIVQRIFKEYADEKRSLTYIANRLNDEGVPFVQGGKWTTNTVCHALERPQYMGMHVWGRTTAFLSGPAKKVASDKWAVCPNAFRPIISAELFERAQKRLSENTYRLSNQQLLEKLRVLLVKHGRLSVRIIDKSRLCPSASSYAARFGGLLNAYALLGYTASDSVTQINLRLQTAFVRRGLMQKLVDCFTGQIEVVPARKNVRSMLRLRASRLLVSVVVARFYSTRATKQPRWIIYVPKSERKRIAIVGLMNEQNSALKSMRVFLNTKYENGTSFKFGADCEWLQAGQPLGRVEDFLQILNHIRQ